MKSEDEYKEIVSEKMQIVGSALHEYKYSSGYKLEFLGEDREQRFATVILKSSPQFDKLGELKVSRIYHVIGWKNKQ